MYGGRTQEVSMLPANGPGTQLREGCVLGVELLGHDGKSIPALVTVKGLFLPLYFTSTRKLSS